MKPNAYLEKAIAAIKLEYGIKTQKALMERLEYSTPGYLSNLLNGKIELTDRFARKLEEKFNINIEYLMSGAGPIFRSVPLSADPTPLTPEEGRPTEEVVEEDNLQLEFVEGDDNSSLKNAKIGDNAKVVNQAGAAIVGSTTLQVTDGDAALEQLGKCEDTVEYWKKKAEELARENDELKSRITTLFNTLAQLTTPRSAASS